MADKTKTLESSADTPRWLFSFGASDVQTSSNRRRHMKFTFDIDNSSAVTAFTDRPDRLTNQFSMKKFEKSFDKIFGKDKPNASATHWGTNGTFNNHVYEIIGIKRNGNAFTVMTNLPQEDYIDTVISKGSSTDLNTTEIPNPFSIAEANFFVDSSASCWIPIIGNLCI